ncbi:MAG: PDZ domain-containing protein [Halieaceae bacterium]
MTTRTTTILLLATALLAPAAYRWLFPLQLNAVVSTPAVSDSQMQELPEALIQLDREQRMASARLADLEQQLLQLQEASAMAPAGELSTPEQAAQPSAPARRAQKAGAESSERVEEAGLTADEYASMEGRAYELYLDSFKQEWLQRRDRYLSAERTPTSSERLRQELGDDAYDRYLYASGGSNRVRVRRVLPGSAAEMAGLAEGDTVLSYDGMRVFNFEDLRGASYQGELGDAAILEVRRADDTVIQVVLPRGPMGISGYGGWREAPGD